MKKFFFIIIFLHSILIIAEVPQKLKYQSVLRNSEGNVIMNKEVNMRIYITDKYNNEVYYEEFNVKTSINGLINYNIGEGLNKKGSFEEIDWGKGEFFIEFEVDTENKGIFERTEKNPFLSVPFALHSKTADKIIGLKYSDINGRPELISSLKNDIGYISIESQNLLVRNDSLYLSNTINTNYINLSKYNNKLNIDSVKNNLKLNYYNKTEIDTKIIYPLIYIDTNLGKKADTSNVYKRDKLYTISEIDDKFKKAKIDTAQIYYSSTDNTNINKTEILNYFIKEKKSIDDKKIEFTLYQDDKHFIFVIPDCWSEPIFYYSNNNYLLNVFDKLKTVTIDNILYAVWVSNVKFPISSIITMK